MKLVLAHARAFGPLRDRTLGFSPRMTVVYGPNEAGKSSWHAAIHAALCGRRRGGRTKAEQEFAEQYTPWNGGEWVVSVAVDLADGSKLEVSQVLDDPAASKVVERDTGRDVTSRFLADGSPDLSRVLGLTRETMPAISTVRQAEITRVQEDASALQAQLQAATSKAGADVTAEAAIERISDYKSEHVGLRRSNSKRPLQTAINGRDEAAREHSIAKKAHEGYLELVARREEAEARAGAAESRLLSARYLLRVAELDEQRQRLRRARDLQQSLPEGERPDIDGLEKVEDRIREVLTRYEERPEAPEPLEGPSAEDLEKELEALPEPPDGDLEVAEEVSTAHQAWREALSELSSHDRYRPDAPDEAEARGADPTELRRLADALEAPEPRPDENLGRELQEVQRRLGRGFGSLAAIVGGAGLLVAGVVLMVQGLAPAWWIAAFSLGLILLVLGIRPSSGRRELERRARSLETQQAVVEQEIRRHSQERSRATSRVAELDLPSDPGELRREARELEAAVASREKLEDWLDKRGELERLAADRARELEAALASRLDADDGAIELPARFERYERDCRERRELARLAAKRPDLESSVRIRRSLEEASEKATAKRETAESALRQLAEDLDVEAEDSRDAVAKLEQRADDIEKTLVVWREAASGLAKLEEILGGRDLEELEREVSSLADAVGDEPEGLEAVDLGDERDETLAALQREYEERRDELANLRGQITDRETRLPSVAEAEEALSQAEEELERVESLEGTLERTLAFLGAARERVQRDLVPHLRRALEEDLSVVTGGRYARARVDPESLEVTVQESTGKSGSNGEWRQASLLSHGTTEQIYLLLRIALARHMVALGEPSPVFLDDPTVQCDTPRTIAILEVLEALSEKHQIILFSQEEDVRQWAASRDDPEVVKLIELTAP